MKSAAPRMSTRGQKRKDATPQTSGNKRVENAENHAAGHNGRDSNDVKIK